MSLTVILPIIFLTGIILIALEDFIKVNKAAVSVSMCVLMWVILLTHMKEVITLSHPAILEAFYKAWPSDMAQMSNSEVAGKYFGWLLENSLGGVSSTLLFVLASMAIVEILDANGAFNVITNAIRTREKRALVWVVSFITFFLSAILGNLATVIIIVAVLRRIIPDRDVRLPFSCLSIIAANAGGCWSPIGDVTTLLLWSAKNISAPHQVTHLILPALAMVSLPALIVSLSFKKGDMLAGVSLQSEHPLPAYLTDKVQSILLAIGILTLVMVPVFQTWFNMPPYMCVLCGLAILWILTDKMASHSNDPRAGDLKMSHLFSHLDIATVLFFLGVLMSVEALKQVGSLTVMANAMNSAIPEPNIIAIILGVCSSVLDNVALVAATMGMYPLAQTGAYMADSSFWTFLAFCAVTGGSILIIGSASGVTVMGLEKVKFGYYLKKFTPLAIIGYVAGCAAYLLFFS